MTPTKKIFFFGLVIFLSLFIFYFSEKAQAQSCLGGDGSCMYISQCPSSCDFGSDGGTCDPNDGVTCCADPATTGCDAGGSGSGSGSCGDPTYGCDVGYESCDPECTGGFGGCLNPNCSNYDWNATYDDGSCTGCSGGGGTAVNCFDATGQNANCSDPLAVECYDSNWQSVTCPGGGGGATACETNWGGTCTSNCAATNNVGVFGCTNGEECCVLPTTGTACETNWGGTCTSTCAPSDNVGVFGCTNGEECCVPSVTATECETNWGGTCTSNCAATYDVGIFGCTGGEACCVPPTTGNACETDWGGSCVSGCAAAYNVGVFGCTGGTACCVPPVASSETFLDSAGNIITGAYRNAQGTIVNSSGIPIAGATAAPTNSGTNSPTPGVNIVNNLATIHFGNPLQDSDVPSFLRRVLGTIQGVIAILAVIFIVIGGIMYITSAGSETAITRAKSTITAALVGLAIALAAPSFLAEIMTIIGSTAAGPSGASTFSQIASRTLTFLLSVVGIIGIIGLVIGGYSYVTAYGSEKKLDTAKTIIQYSLIGIVVALAAVILVRQVATIMGIA